MDNYGENIDHSSLVEQLPASIISTSATTAAAAGEEKMKTSVDTSGFGMYSSGTGTGAITGGGLLPHQYATTVTAIQTQLPSLEDDEMEGKRKIEEKVGLASDADMTTSTNGNVQQGETHHGKKGLMERIKEKLPGHHHH